MAKASYQHPAPAPHGPTGRKVPFSASEISAIRVNLATAPSVRDLALFEAGLSTMLRSTDLLSLRVADVIDTAGNVVESLTVKMAKASTRARICRSVVVRLSSNARTAIAELIQVEGKNPADPLFTRPGCPHGKPLTTMQLRRLTKQWASVAGIDPATVAGHSLRRTQPVRIYAATRNAEAVRLLLGHKTLDSTSSYLGVGQGEALALAAQYDVT